MTTATQQAELARAEFQQAIKDTEAQITKDTQAVVTKVSKKARKQVLAGKVKMPKAPKVPAVTTKEPKPTSGNVVPLKYRLAYGKDANCGDTIAGAFEKLGDYNIADLVAVMTKNGIDENRWAEKNIGMLRMNLGNVLRGLQTKQDVFIGSVTLKKLPAKPKAEKAA